jgi:hypothetical protein
MKSGATSEAATTESAEGTEMHQAHGEIDRGRTVSPRRKKASFSQTSEPTGDQRPLTLQIAAMEYVWLYDHRHGLSLNQIAARANATTDDVMHGVERAIELERRLSERPAVNEFKTGRPDDTHFRLIPLFPIVAFTPQSACPHHNPIEEDSRLCCMVCHKSGMDDHPGLLRDPETDPSPEPTPRPAKAVRPARSGEAKNTRKQRRHRKFAEVALA